MSKELRLIDPDIGGEEIEAVSSLLADPEALPYVAFVPRPGGRIQELITAFAAFLQEGFNSSHPVAAAFLAASGLKDVPISVAGFSSATGALYAGLRSIGAEAGEVITTSLNYMGVPNALLMAGASPNFVDVDPKTFCMDASLIEKAVSKKTRAVLLTHLNTFCDLSPYIDLFQRKGYEFPLVQDASLAVGSTRGGLKPGVINIGEKGFTVFSLATSKVITGLGGGVMTARDPGLIERSLSIAYQGMSFREIGVLETNGANLKMNELNASIAIERLKKRDVIFEKRRRLKQVYDHELAPLAKAEKIELQKTGNDDLITHYVAIMDDRNALAQKLYARGRIHLGMWHVYHLQKCYKGPAVKLPVTERLHNRFTLLPFHTRLTEEDAVFICDCLKEELKA